MVFLLASSLISCVYGQLRWPDGFAFHACILSVNLWVSVGSAGCWLVSCCSGWDDWGRLSSALVSHTSEVLSGSVCGSGARGKCLSVHMIVIPLLTSCLPMSHLRKHVLWLSPDSRHVKTWAHQCHQPGTSGSTLFLHISFYMDFTPQFREDQCRGYLYPTTCSWLKRPQAVHFLSVYWNIQFNMEPEFICLRKPLA